MEPRETDQVRQRLAESPFRRRFTLSHADVVYLRTLDHATLAKHIKSLLTQRLGPAQPVNDGRQTPMRGKPRGHPVFLAQHATATCCRSCLAKWHRIPKGRALNPDQLEHLRLVIERWLDAQRHEDGLEACNKPSVVKPQPTLFEPPGSET